MPLIKSSSDAARSKNVAEMIRSGHKPDQAVAAAYSTQREARRKGMATGGAVTPERTTKVEDSHIKGIASLPKHADKSAGNGVTPMRHRNRLGIQNLQKNPQGSGKPTTESKIANARKTY